MYNSGETMKPSRLYTQRPDRGDGSLIIRFKRNYTADRQTNPFKSPGQTGPSTTTTTTTKRRAVCGAALHAEHIRCTAITSTTMYICSERRTDGIRSTIDIHVSVNKILRFNHGSYEILI